MSDRIASNANDDVNNLNSLRRSPDSIFLNTVSTEEVSNLITKLNLRKSPGFDNISAEIYKACSDVISPRISKLTNMIFNSGTYPDALKVAKTIPVYKAGDAKLMVNYRPISLLNILNKIIEQLIYSRLYNFLNNYFYKFQYGFRKKIKRHIK